MGAPARSDGCARPRPPGRPCSALERGLARGGRRASVTERRLHKGRHALHGLTTDGRSRSPRARRARGVAMSPLDAGQHHAVFELLVSALARAELRVIAFRGTEALSRLFRFDIDFLTHHEPEELEADAARAGGDAGAPSRPRRADRPRRDRALRLSGHPPGGRREGVSRASRPPHVAPHAPHALAGSSRT